jgi:hypothetical protein
MGYIEKSFNMKKLILLLNILIISCDTDLTPKIETDPEIEKWKVLSSELVDLALFHGNNPENPYYITGNTLHTHVFLTYTLAINNGWEDDQTLNSLNNAYSLIDSLKYGLGYEWDAFQDGTINSKFTNYTITMTYHVGYPFIQGYKAGAIPILKLIDLIDSVLNVPLADSLENGTCWAYSDNPNDVVGCVHNVNISVAFFLEQIMQLGFYEYNFTDEINSIVDRELHSFLPEHNNYLYWDGQDILTDQNHLAHQAWFMYNLSDEEIQTLGSIIIDEISNNRQKDIKSLVGQLLILQTNNFQSDSLYVVIKRLLNNEESEYFETGSYSFSNPRILAQLALYSIKFYQSQLP